MNWNYDANDGRYYVYGATIDFPNFEGRQTKYNNKGCRNYKLRIDEELYDALCKQGVHANAKVQERDGIEETMYSVKVGVYPTSRVFTLEDIKRRISEEELKVIDDEAYDRKIANGEIDLSFHVSLNSQTNSYYLRTDDIYIPLRMSALDRKYENYGENRGEE